MLEIRSVVTVAADDFIRLEKLSRLDDALESLLTAAGQFYGYIIVIIVIPHTRALTSTARTDFVFAVAIAFGARQVAASQKLQMHFESIVFFVRFAQNFLVHEEIGIIIIIRHSGS